MGQAQWDDFVSTGTTYMLYVNNRPPDAPPSSDELAALTAWRVAAAALSAPERVYYSDIGGPNFLIKSLQVSGGGRSTS